MRKFKHGILGHLITEINNLVMIKVGKGEFLNLVTNMACQFDPKDSSVTFAWDFIPKSLQESVIHSLNNTATCKKNLMELLGPKDTDKEIIRKFSDKMKAVIKNVDIYTTKRINAIHDNDIKEASNLKTLFPPNSTGKFNSESKKHLLEYFTCDLSSSTLKDYIYIITYWAMVKTLPPTFFFELNYKKQLTEFNTAVVCRYGVNSQGGKRILLDLCKSNIFAMYEVGNLYYFGMRYDLKPDYQKALHYFKQSAGISSNGEIDQSKCNPLALWVISYMYRNYRKNLDLADLDYNTVPEIECLSETERLSFSIEYCKKSIQLNQCIPAYNLLGLLSRNLNETERQENSLKSPEYYFLEAARQDYPYAYNNLAALEREKIFSSPYSIARKHLDKYLHYLSKAAELDEPWACRKLGQFYLEGKITLQDLELSFPSKKDSETAYKYFHKAISEYNNESSAIAYAYLLVHFQDKYDSTIALESLLMSCCALKSLNALVYLFENIGKDILPKLSLSVRENAYNNLVSLDADNALLKLAQEKLYYKPI